MIFVLFYIIQVCLGDVTMELGQTYDGAITPWQNDSKYKLYSLQIKEVIPDRDLILVVKQLSAIGNPDIYISTKTREPNQFTNDIKCESVGLDICVINKVEVTTYHIAVHCEDFCRFQLKAVYEAELQMSNSDDLEFKFNNEEWTEVVRINVQEFEQLLYSDSQTLEVQVRIKNIEIMEERFVSYLNIGDQIPNPEKYDYIGEDTFSGMQKFKIKNINLQQKFTLLIEGQQGAIVAIQTRTYGGIHQMYLGEKIEDIVQDGQFQFYCINLTQDVESLQKGNTILNIQLLPYKGYTQMYVNLDYQPSFIDGYYWQLNDTITDDLVITSEDLIKAKAKGGLAFVAVRAIDSNATYELRSSLFDPNFMVLEWNKPATAKLNKNSQIQYKFYIRANKKETVSVSLKNIYGDADIIVKQCSALWQCKIDNDEIKNRVMKTNNEPGKLFLFSELPGNDIIVFDNNPDKCHQIDNTFQCYYVVLIYPGPKNEVDELTYSILVTAKGEQTLLRENTPMKQFVNHELYNYYKFVIEENDQIRRLMIQITPIQGQPKLYVSQTEQRPTKEKYDQQGVQNLVSYGGRQNHEPIKGTFYIGVYGYTASQYIITTNVIRGRGDWRQYGKFSNQYQLLLDGYPHESNTNNQTEIQLYKIDLSAYYNPDYIEHQQVEIYLRIIQGEFMMYAFDHPEVDINKAFLTGKNELILSHSSKIYPQYLYIRIEPNQQLNLSTYSYQIYYRIDQQPIELVIGNNFDGYIQKENTQTFFFNYYKDEDLIISKHVENHDQSIVTATVYFGQETMTLQGQSLTLHKEQLQFDKCKTNATEIVKCQISIFVISKENTYYQLLITKDQSIVKLFDGEPVTKPIRNQTDYYTFLLSNIETEISVFSISGEIRILANITKNGYPTLDQFPKSDKDSLLQSLNDQYEIGSSIFISPDLYDEYQCFQDNCYVTITCMSINTRTSSLGDYTITRTSSVIPLSEGFLYQSEIKEQRIKYFKVQSIPAGQGLMIIATPLSQGSLIIVASENEMPTIDTHQYSSNSMFGDQLIIEPNKEDIDTIYIGVYSFEKVKFSIQINIGTTHFYQIRRGQPFNFFQQYNSTYYLNYFHAIDSEFMILISHNQISQYGRPNISVTTYKDMTDQAKTLVTENYKWNMMDQYLIINKQQDYCTNCYYLIRIQNFNSDTDFTATISAKNESIHLLDNLEQSNLLQINDIHYYHYSSENNDFYINTTLIKGKISIYGGFFNQKDEIDKLLFYLDENEGLLDKNGEIVKGRQGLLVNGTKFINQTDRNNKENNGPLYRIKVQSTVQSVYKIECISTQQAIELRLGEPQRQYLNGQSISVFYFYIPTTPFFSRKNPFYSITIETYGQSQKKIREKDQFPQIQLLKDEFNNPDYNSEYHNFTNVLINLNNQTNLLMYFEISNEAGVYFLKIKPREYSTLPYIVTLGNDDLNVLPSQLQRFVNSKPGQSRFWEVTINKPQKLLIQAQLCNGKISVFENEDLNELKQGIYKQKLEYRHNRQVVGTFDANKNGTYYISTQALKGKYDLVSYILSLNILEPNSIIVDEHFEPGEGGDLTLNYNKPNISVQFKSVRIAELSSQDYKLLGISYFLIHKYQEINDDQPIALCDETILFPSFHIKAAKHKSDQYLSFNNAIDTNFEKVLVTVMARVKTITNNHEYINYDYFYNTETIKQDNLILYQKTHEFKKGILAIILTILLIIIVYLLMRNRRLKQSLKYEQSEQTLQKLRSEQAIEMNYTNLR